MVNTHRSQRLINLFAAAVELDAPHRIAFVERRCSDDRELRDELLELLRVEARGMGPLLSEPIVRRPPDIARRFRPARPPP